MSQFVAPTGYVDLDNDCEFSIDLKSTRSRESVNPKEDLAFYFNTYIVPKYGLNNINVSNVASFMKDLEMNWTKLSPDMKDKVMNIMVDDILNKDTSFRNAFLQKLNINTTPVPNQVNMKSSFGKSSKFSSNISSFGKPNSKILIMVAIVILIIFIFLKKNKKMVSYGRLS